MVPCRVETASKESLKHVGIQLLERPVRRAGKERERTENGKAEERKGEGKDSCSCIICLYGARRAHIQRGRGRRPAAGPPRGAAQAVFARFAAGSSATSWKAGFSSSSWV